MREFISPVLVGCLALFPDTKAQIVAERRIVGTRAQGPVDYDIFYDLFHLLVIEAKKDKILEGVVQNFVQLVASRDDCQFNRLKRKRDPDQDDIETFPSIGVVSTGNDWIFTMYVRENNEWKLYRSKDFKVTLSLDSTSEQMQSQVSCLLKMLLSLIRSQVDLVDQMPEIKRHCSNVFEIEEHDDDEEEED
jgi:hypothetical protein